MPTARSRPASVLVKLDISGRDHAGRHRIDADPAGTEQRGKVLHRCVNGAFGCCIGRDRSDNVACRERCDKNDTAFQEDRKQLLDHHWNARRYLTRTARNTCVIEKNHLVVLGEAVGYGPIPIIQSPAE
jgi:hypothetical protein